MAQLEPSMSGVVLGGVVEVVGSNLARGDIKDINQKTVLNFFLKLSAFGFRLHQNFKTQ